MSLDTVPAQGNAQHSIPELPTMTHQQIFDMSLAHVRKTRTKSMKQHSTLRSICAYSGVGCAASPFLRPESRELMDNLNSARGAAWDLLVNRGLVSPHAKRLIDDLQSCHDGAEDSSRFMEQYESQMASVAITYGLTYAPENKS